ncbi:hypothetical protein [Pseudolabrys sp.]|uniref:hypothetical protein n=1 Tax=Pseudolabrys sp. TaxID=1960880 RepID=UPI003D0EB8CE
MANRSMEAKASRARRQRIDAANHEMLKPAYRTGKPVVPSYDLSMVKRYPTGQAATREGEMNSIVRRTGKGGRWMAHKTYGNGERLVFGGAISQAQGGSALIRGSR